MEMTRILVAFTGTKADVEALRLASKLANKAKSKVYVVYVIEVERSLPLDAELEPEMKKGEAVLSKAELIAEEHNCEVETDLLQAREAGPAIVDEAIERGVGMIVLGMGYKKHFGEFSLGQTIPYVLKNAPCAVMIYREPIPKEEIASH